MEYVGTGCGKGREVAEHIQMTLRIIKVQQYYDTGRTVHIARSTGSYSRQVRFMTAAVYDYGQMGVELKNNINADLWIQPCGHPLGQEQGASAASADTGGRSVFVG